MALIACPDCGKQISTTAKHCFACGYDMGVWRSFERKKFYQFAKKVSDFFKISPLDFSVMDFACNYKGTAIIVTVPGEYSSFNVQLLRGKRHAQWWEDFKRSTETVGDDTPISDDAYEEFIQKVLALPECSIDLIGCFMINDEFSK